MADTKISGLTLAATPLDGTEVLPIVQSSTTKKVANNDLRPKQIQSNATSGVLQVVGPAAASTRVMTTPDANFTVARTDAAQSFTGDQTLSTGNLIQGTAAKGFDFSANTGAAGKTSSLLNWYEEGTWTPSIGSSGTAPTIGYTIQVGNYTRIGRMVYFSAEIVTSSATGGTGALRLTGLPFTAGSSRYVGGIEVTYSSGWTTQAPQIGYVYQGTTYVDLGYNGTTATNQSTVAHLTNGAMTLIAVGWFTV